MADELNQEQEEQFDTGDETEQDLPVETDDNEEPATQALLDFALAQEPASFKDALADIMHDKCSDLLDKLREEMSKSVLQAEKKDFPFKKKGDDDDDDDDDKDDKKDKFKKKDKDDDDDDDDDDDKKKKKSKDKDCKEEEEVDEVKAFKHERGIKKAVKRADGEDHPDNETERKAGRVWNDKKQNFVPLKKASR